jgi:hypothetical protein
MAKWWWLVLLAFFVGACLVVTVVVLLMPDREPGDALITSLAAVVSWAAIVFVSYLAGTRSGRAAATGGYIDVTMRSPDGHPLLSRRWRPALVRPADGALRITPLAGPSVAPFTVAVGTIEEVKDPRTWRELLTGPIGDARFVRITEDAGTVEIAVPAKRFQRLLDAVDPSTANPPEADDV